MVSEYKVHLFETPTTWSIRINRTPDSYGPEFDVGIDFRNDGKKIPRSVISNIADYLVECLEHRDDKAIQVVKGGAIEVVSINDMNRMQKRKILFN